MCGDGTDETQSRLAIEAVPTADERHAVLRLRGELDPGTAPTLRDAVVEVMAGSRCHLALDLSSVTRCDTAVLYALLGVHSALRSAGGGLTLAAESPPVRSALDRTGLRGRLPSAPGTGHLPPL